MGFWSNIKNRIQEAIRRVRTPKLPEAKVPWFNQQGELNAVTGTSTRGSMTALNQYGQSYQREDEIAKKIMVARIMEAGNDGTILVGNENYVAFEMPAEYEANNIELLKVVEQWYHQAKDYNKGKECIFLGNMYENNSPEFMQNMQAWVDQNIGSQIKAFKEMENQKRAEAQKENDQMAAQKQAFDNRIKNERLAEKLNQESLIRNERINNPYINFKSSYKDSYGKTYMDYDGININNGDILRLRKVDKIGIDSHGNYLYSGYMSSVNSKSDVEIFRNKEGMPGGKAICFSLPGSLEDIVARNDSNEIRRVLALFSKEENFRNNGQMNFIGALDREGNISQNVETREMFDAIINLQSQYAKDNPQKQQAQDGQEWTQ